MSTSAPEVTRTAWRGGSAGPERPGPQGQERGSMSTSAPEVTRTAWRGGSAGPERPGPEGQERGT